MSIRSQAPLGVLLMAYGSPNSLDEVLPYYTDVRGGHAPSAENLAIVYDHYARVGGSTGLLAISEAQVAGLQLRLDDAAPGAYRVYLGMRHWRPFIADTVKRMAEDGIREAVGIALAPHDSRVSVGGYIASVENALTALATSDASSLSAPRFTFVRSWHVEPHFLQLLAERIEDARKRLFSPEEQRALHVIFSAHSLPERVLSWHDPYPAQLRETIAGVARRLGLDEAQWSLAYQSAGRTPEPWLGPSIQETLPLFAQQGCTSALVCPIGFISDNLEILYDIDIDCRERAASVGLHLERIAMPNADPLLIEALASATRHATHELLAI